MGFCALSRKSRFSVADECWKAFKMRSVPIKRKDSSYITVIQLDFQLWNCKLNRLRLTTNKYATAHICNTVHSGWTTIRRSKFCYAEQDWLYVIFQPLSQIFTSNPEWIACILDFIWPPIEAFFILPVTRATISTFLSSFFHLIFLFN